MNRSSLRAVIAVLVAAVLVVVAVLITLSLTRTAAEPYFVFFLLMTYGVAGSALLLQAQQGRQLDFLSPFVLVPVTMGVVYGGAPALLLREGAFDAAEQVTSALVLGMVAYLLGAFFISLTSGAAMIGSSSREFASVTYRPRVLWTVFGLGAAAMIFYWARAGGVPILQSDLENSRVEALSGSGVPFYLSMLMMVSTWMSIKEGSGIGWPGRLTMLSIGSLLLFSTGWRNTVFAFVIVALLIWYYTHRVRSIYVLAAGVVAVLGVVGIGLYRVFSSGITTYATYRRLASGDLFGAVTTYLETYADGFARNLSVVFQVTPSVLPFQNGETIVWNFLALLPGQAREPFDFVLKRAAGQGFEGGGLPPTLVGEWYINFGWLGVGLGMGATGIAVALAHRASRNSATYVGFVISVLLIYYAFVAVRGGIGNVALTVGWLILALLVVNSIAVVRGPRGRDPLRSAALVNRKSLVAPR